MGHDATMAAEVADYVAIRRLQAAYADVVSRRAWIELEPLFEPGCEIVVDRRNLEPLVLRGAAQLGEFVGAAIERYEFFEFTILNSVVDLAVGAGGDRARARLWMCELRLDRDSGHWSNAYGVYHDAHHRGAAGRWRFARRRYHPPPRPAPRARPAAWRASPSRAVRSTRPK